MQLPMSLMKDGASAIIENLALSRDIMLKMFDLGIRPGVQFRVLLSNSDFVIKLGQTKIAIDRALCRKIIVSIA